MRHIFLVNPVAGKENAGKTILPPLFDKLKQKALSFQVIETQYAGHAAQLAEQIGQEGEPARIYVCGGDGTLNEAIAGARKFANVAVGSVPCGSGNDMIRNFGTQQEFMDLEDYVAGSPIVIDLIDAGGDAISASICSAGLDAKVAYGIPAFRRLPLCSGPMAYNLSIIKCLLQPLGCRFDIVLEDGNRYSGNYLLACIANGSYYGGGYKGAPNARMDDGLLDVILVKKISRFRIASILSAYKKGEHFERDAIKQELQKYVSYVRTKE
ncbi:MAG: diacylglycerol kinase family protein, partial [Oscillospiraceae bacterium]|nr:diacylglycerol kinase family protein [Oscillospiraceae bacterium]